MPDPTETKASLNALTLEQLSTIHCDIGTVLTAASILEDQGFEPRISLCPGEPVTLQIAPILPDVFSSMPSWLVPLTARHQADPEPAPFPPPPSDDAADRGGADPVPLVEQPIEARPAPGVPAFLQAIEAKGIDPLDPEAEALAREPVPGSTRELATKAAAYDAWTEDEDRLAVTMAAKGLQLGLAWKRIAQDIHDKLPLRTAAAINLRLRTKLERRVQSALDELQAALKDAERTPAVSIPPEPEPAPDPEPAAPPSTAEAPAHLRPVLAHLMALPSDKGETWTLAQDKDIVDLAILGWKIDAIAVELGRDSRAVARRYDQLTGLTKDEATDKPLRRFNRELLADALQWAVGAQA